MSTDDLSKPLGQAKKKKRRFVLPMKVVTRGIAGALALCVAVLAGWIMFVDAPFGGEPMAVVSASLNGASETKKPGDEHAPGKPETATHGEPDKPGGKTVTIIDGSTGKRQEVTVTAPGAKPESRHETKSETKPARPETKLPGKTSAAPEAIDQRLLEPSRHGPIPRIGADGARPSEVYARALKADANRPDLLRIAIVVEGLGIGANNTAQALAKLPAAVTCAFAPYGTDLERWVSRARGEGHEVLLQIAMEPFDYPDNDPGPQTLLTSISPEQNIDRLSWFLSRFQGYVGVTGMMGTRFTATELALGPVLREIGKRGLIYFDDGTSPRSVAGQAAGSSNVAFARSDAVLDAVATAGEIDNALARLEDVARSRGVAVGTVSALPVSIDRIAQWAKGAEARGILLVPVSAVARQAKTST